MSAYVATAAAVETARPTIGVGVATAPEHSWNGATLLRQADAALYAAKRRVRLERSDDLA
jgi:GGDEF domain-containing protein